MLSSERFVVKYRKLNDEVLYPDEPIVQVDRDFIELMKRKADTNVRERIRLCAHQDERDDVHEMIIIHKAGTYVRPHKHLNRSESFHIIEGQADVVIFNDNGEVTDRIAMGTYSSGRHFYYRLADPLYHTLLISSDYVVFHETTSGPFKREETVFPAWAPEEDDTAAVEAFIEDLRCAVGCES